MDDVLGDLDLPYQVGGVWLAEQRFRTSQVLMRSSSLVVDSFDAGAVLDAAQKLYDPARHSATSAFVGPSGEVTGRMIEDVVEWIRTSGISRVSRPLPGGDRRPTGAHGWIWDFYSPRRLGEFYAELFDQATEAYEQFAQRYLTQFKRSLSTRSELDLRVVGEVHHSPDSDHEYGSASVSYMMVPSSMAQEVLGLAPEPPVLSKSGRSAIVVQEVEPVPRTPHWLYEFFEGLQGEAPPVAFGLPRFSWTYSTSVADAMGSHRPASQIAVDWLWRDLEVLGLTSGSAPALR
jgi:hypothetical protein